MSLYAIASPDAREPGPLVTFVLKRTVAKVLSIGLLEFYKYLSRALDSLEDDQSRWCRRNVDRSFQEFALMEHRPGTDQRDQVRSR